MIALLLTEKQSIYTPVRANVYLPAILHLSHLHPLVPYCSVNEQKSASLSQYFTYLATFAFSLSTIDLLGSFKKT